MLADNGPLMVLRHLDALSVDDRVKLERFSHEHQLMCYLADGSGRLNLFFGMGNFTLPVGKFIQNAVGVEGVAALVR